MNKQTLDILKNFSTIKDSIYFDEGNVIKVKNQESSIIGIYKDTFEYPKHGLFKISELIHILTSNKDVDQVKLDYKDDKVIIQLDNKTKVKFFYANERLFFDLNNNLLIQPSEKYYNIDTKYDTHATISLDDELMKKIKLAKTMKLNKMTFEITNDEVTIQFSSPDNSNTMSYQIGAVINSPCTVSILIEDLNFYPGVYNINIKDKLIYCKHNDIDLTYIITGVA